MPYVYETGVCCCSKEPDKLCIEIQNKVHFSVKAKKCPVITQLV